MSRRGNWFLFAGSLVMALAAAELVLRLFHPQTMGYSYRNRDGLQTHVPGAKGLYRRDEFAAEVRFNALGFRGREVAIPKPPGTNRILALGDSFTAGLQVDEGELFTTRIEASLRSLGPGVEVVNLGVSGYGTDDELDVLNHYGDRLEPDRVLVFVFAGNDVLNNLARGRCTIPRGRLECEPLKRLSTPEWLYRRLRSEFTMHSHLFQLARAATETRRWPNAAMPAAGLPAGALASRDPDVDLYLREEPEYLTAGYALTGALLGAIRVRAAQLGARTDVVVLPAREQVEDARWAEIVERARGAALDRDRPQSRLRATAASARLDVVDALPGFLERARMGDALYFRVDAHFTPAGHAVAAAVVVRFLTQGTRSERARRGVAPTG